MVLFHVFLFIQYLTQPAIAFLMDGDGVAAFDEAIKKRVLQYGDTGLVLKQVKGHTCIYYQTNQNPREVDTKDVIFFSRDRVKTVKSGTVRLNWRYLPVTAMSDRTHEDDTFKNRVEGFVDLIYRVFRDNLAIKMNEVKLAEVVRKFMAAKFLHATRSFAGLSLLIPIGTVDLNEPVYIPLIKSLLPCLVGQTEGPVISKAVGTQTYRTMFARREDVGKNYEWNFNPGSICILNLSMVAYAPLARPLPMPFIKPWNAFLTASSSSYVIGFNGMLYFSTQTDDMNDGTPITRMICNGSLQLKDRMHDMIFNVPTYSTNAGVIKSTILFIVKYIGPPDTSQQQQRICVILYGIVMSSLLQYVSMQTSNNDPFAGITEPYVCSFIFSEDWLKEDTTLKLFLDELSRFLLNNREVETVQALNIHSIHGFNGHTIYWNVAGSSCELVVNPQGIERADSCSRTDSAESDDYSLGPVLTAVELDEYARAFSDGEIPGFDDGIVIENGVLLEQPPPQRASLRAKFSSSQNTNSSSSTTTKSLRLLLANVDRVLEQVL